MRTACHALLRTEEKSQRVEHGLLLTGIQAGDFFSVFCILPAQLTKSIKMLLSVLVSIGVEVLAFALIGPAEENTSGGRGCSASRVG